MRMLSVANVATLLGGTGACALDCIRSLPDWEHAVVFCSGREMLDPSREFGCPIYVGPAWIDRQLQDWRPDVVLWHNTDISRLPHVKRGRWVYYQHSHYAGAVEARQRCDVRLCVSRYLGIKTGLPETAVLPQPVAAPEFRHGRVAAPLTIGRLCTPLSAKWGKGLPEFYRALAADHPDAAWEFVGCPAEMQRTLAEACRGRATFHPPSREARGLLWRWHALLYSGGPETYGRTVCEAQQCGCVPIVDDRGGFVEQIRDGVDGFLCRDLAAFSSAVGTLRDGLTLSRMSAAANDAGAERGSMRRWGAAFQGISGT